MQSVDAASLEACTHRYIASSSLTEVMVSCTVCEGGGGGGGVPCRLQLFGARRSVLPRGFDKVCRLQAAIPLPKYGTQMM